MDQPLPTPSPTQRPSSGRKSEGEEVWLYSYGDLITVLMAFFAFLAGISTIDTAKLEAMAGYFAEEQGKTPLAETKKVIESLIQEKKLEQDISVTLGPKGLEVNFSDKVLFDIGKAQLKLDSKAVVGAIASVANKPPVHERMISVEGHTDSLPIKTIQFPSNWELSGARAAEVVRFFIEKGTPKNRLEAVGYADTRPKIEKTYPLKGQPANRRVTVIIK